MTRRAKLIRNVAIGFAAFLVFLFVAAIITVQTNWFRETVKQKIIAAAEEGTGGKVEIGSFQFEWTHLRAIATGFVIHGIEPAGSPPWIRVRRIQLDLRLFGNFSHVVGLSYLGLDHAEATVSVLPDGSTNIPTPKEKSTSSSTPLETVVDLAVGHFELTNGLLVFNSVKQALNVRGENLRAQLAYSVLTQTYQGQISLQPLYVVSGRNTPVKFTVALPLRLARDRIDLRGARIYTAGSQLLIDASAENLRNPKTAAHISGRVSLADLKNCGNLPLAVPAAGPLSALDLDANATVADNAIDVKRLYVALGHSTLEAAGKLKDAAGNGSMVFEAKLNAGELGRLAQVSARPDGSVSLNGTAKLDRQNNYQVDGTIAAKDVSFEAGATRVGSVNLTSGVRLDPHRLDLADLRLTALGGELSGNGSLVDRARYQFTGKLSRFDLRAAAVAIGQKDFPYAGVASGPVAAEGDLNVPGTKSQAARAKISIAPGKGAIPISGRLNADYSGAADNINIADSYIALPSTRLTLSGSPGRRLDLQLTTHNLNDLLAAMPASGPPPVALEPGGQATLSAAVTGSLSAPRIAAHLAASRMSAEGRHFDAVAADAAASRTGASVSNGSLTRGAMQMQFAASVGLRNWKPGPDQPLSGTASVRNGDIADLMAMAGQPAAGYAGALSATVSIRGTVGNPLGTASLTADHGAIHGEPFDQIRAQVNMADQLITVPSASLTAGAAHVNLSAELQHPRDSFSTGQLHARLQTSGLNLAQIKTVQKDLPDTAGEVRIQADLNASLSETKAAGDTAFQLHSVSADASAHGLRFKGQNYGDFDATARTRRQTVEYSVKSDFAGSSGTLNGKTELSPGYPTTADAAIANLPVERVLALANNPDLRVKGTLSGSLHFSGTVKKPEGNLDLTLARAVVYDEPIDSVRARVSYLPQRIEVSDFEVAAGPARLTLSATYDHPAAGWQSGNLQFKVNSTGINLARIHNIQKLRPGLAGTIQIAANGTAAVQQTGAPIAFHQLDANLSAKGIAAEGKNLGDLTLTANTTGNRIAFALDSNLAQAAIHGHGNAELSTDYPITAGLTFGNVTWAGLQPLIGQAEEPAAFEAVTDGEVTLSGPLTKTGDLKASLKITRVNLTTKPARGARAVTIQNQAPIAITLDHGVARIDSLHLTGPDTDLQAQGTASITTRALDLKLQANGNLAVISQLDRDIRSSGNVLLAATVRGGLDKPLVNGKLELHDASLNYMQFPNGIAHANGVVQFNGTSAAFQNLTGETGGGKLTLAGFVAFRDGLRFGLRASASNVRVLPQEGMSLVLGANVNLSGTPESSTASGLVTIDQITYAPQSDFGALLSRAPPPVSTAEPPSPLLDNMKLDIRVRTATSMTVRASMAENLEASADLQLRGTASRPGMLGRVTISEGQLVFFNSTYTVNTGTISFYNPLRIDPMLSLSLNTQAKGVDVTLKVSGPVDNMKLTYTSDPPLQFDEIVNLLATGKTPTSDPTILANQPADPQQSFAQMGESAVVGTALADPVASRLQRVFGISQLSISPVFASGSDLPQARITLQQRITSNVTFTYITAVNAPNTQIIRAEWALNPEWAAMATRDENGILSVRLTYKKQVR